MQVIPVPTPPKSAFNKNRRVSDLILHQLRHFQHVAEKQGLKIDPALERDIATEGEAARYIASVTRQIRAQAAAVPSQAAPASSGGTALKSATLEPAPRASSAKSVAVPAAKTSGSNPRGSSGKRDSGKRKS